MEIADILKQTDIFSALSQRELKRVARMARVRDFVSGDVIVKEGNKAAGCFIIASGEVEVVKSKNGSSPVVLSKLGPGEVFGEMSVIETRPRFATVRASADTKCVAIKRDDFRSELRMHPEIALKLFSVLVKRLQDVEKRPA